MIIPEWRRVLRHAWSIRFMGAAILFQAMEIILPFLTDLFPVALFSGLSIIAGLGSLWARFIYQPKVRGRHGD